VARPQAKQVLPSSEHDVSNTLSRTHGRNLSEYAPHKGASTGYHENE
jgi:hypothetical protein